jgi:hypothetical protein
MIGSNVRRRIFFFKIKCLQRHSCYFDFQFFKQSIKKVSYERELVGLFIKHNYVVKGQLISEANFKVFS